MEYPAPGDPALARRAAALEQADLRSDWGLDHGTWAVLLHLRPKADVPVVQLSIDQSLPPERHLALGQALAPLRDEGILIMGSGNITHNLRDAFTRAGRGDLSTPDWAGAFDSDVAQALSQHDRGFLVHGLDGENGRRSHPTPDHYLPLLYAQGASEDRDPVRFPITGFDLGSLSMRAVIFG